MKRLDALLALMLALPSSVGCEAPRQDRAELDGVASDRVEQPARTDDAVPTAFSMFVADTRAAVNELEAAFQDLETKNASLQGESASAWAQASEEIAQAGELLESDLNRLEAGSAEAADQLRSRIAENLETLTHRIQRAELLAIESSEEFATAARERLAQIELNIQSLQVTSARLPMKARAAASQSVQSLRTEANDVRDAVMSIVAAAPQQLAEQRETVAEDVAALFASVRRETFELRAELTS